MKLWADEEEERLAYYPARERKSDTAVLIFPGGAYAFLADHEGSGYAEFLSAAGYDAYVCAYRVKPDAFPLPLLDARRAMRLLRQTKKYKKIVVMGSSAGGNLAALLCTHFGRLPGEDEGEFLPDGQILCYPVITLTNNELTHEYSRVCLTGGNAALYAELTPETHVTKRTPPAFLWHTAGDEGVPMQNTLIYADALTRASVPVEAHIFPGGYHGMGLAQDDPVIGQWTALMLRWLERL